MRRPHDRHPRGRGDVHYRASEPPGHHRAPDHARQRRGTKVTLAWTPIPEDGGIAFYALEYTGVGRTFANARGNGPDPVNGHGGAGGSLVLGGPMTSGAMFPMSDTLELGTYQYRIFPVDKRGVVPPGLTASDAQSLEIVSDGR